MKNVNLPVIQLQNKETIYINDAVINKSTYDCDIPCHYLLQKDMHVSFHAKTHTEITVNSNSL